jgi:hypothetical protein
MRSHFLRKSQAPLKASFHGACSLPFESLRLSSRHLLKERITTPHTQPYADGDGPSTLSNIDVRILRVHHSTLPVRPSRFPSIWSIGVYASAAAPLDTGF